jgi:CheY-like chemotaxis protein
MQCIEGALDFMSVESRGAVLHVEDDAPVREAMAMVLSGDGYSVSSAANGSEALRLVAQGLQPDLLIMDFNLGEEMNGAEATEQLQRALGYTPPVILLTGDPSNAELPWITEMPVWLARKPMSPRLLLAAVPCLVQLSRSTRPLINASTR